MRGGIPHFRLRAKALTGKFPTFAAASGALVTGIGIALVPPPVSGSLISIDFSGTVTTIFATTPPPGGIGVGTPVTGNITYDTTAIPPDTNPADFQRGSYAFTGGKARLSLAANGLQWMTGTNPTNVDTFQSAPIFGPGTSSGLNPFSSCSSGGSCFGSFPGALDGPSSILAFILGPVLPTPDGNVLRSGTDALPTSASGFSPSAVNFVGGQILTSASAGSSGILVSFGSAGPVVIKEVVGPPPPPIAHGSPFAFRVNEGPNSIGFLTDLKISVQVEDVSPNLSTFVTAQQGATTLGLRNLFAETGFSGLSGTARSAFGRTIAFDPSLTGPWAVTLQNGADVLTAMTNNLVGVPALPQPVPTAVAPGLTPTITWTNPPSGFTRNIIDVWDDTTNTRIAILGCFPAANICNSRTIPVGLLAPNGQYTVRIRAENRSDPAVFATTNSFSAASVNFSASSTARENGVVLTESGIPDTGAMIVAGVNSFPDMRVNLGGFNTRGAVTIDSASSLTTNVLAVGSTYAGSFGNLLVDGGSLHLAGSALLTQPGILSLGGSGNGYASFMNGASVLITADGFNGPRFNVGYDGGSGHANVVGAGTTIIVDGSSVTPVTNPGHRGLIGVGVFGTGRLDILSGAIVSNDPMGVTHVGGGAPSGRGSITVDGPGSRLNAGAILQVGGLNVNGPGTEGRVSAQNGGIVAATNINVNDGGLLTGDGTYIGTVTLNTGGFIAPGLSPGLMVIDGDLILDSGIVLLEAFGLTEEDKIRVTGNAVFGAAVLQVLLGYDPDPAHVFDFFDVLGTTTIQDDFGGIEAFALAGSGAGGSEIMVRLSDMIFTVTAAGVPEPGTITLLAVALAGLGVARRRKLH